MKTPISTDNAIDIVDAIDELIQMRLNAVTPGATTQLIRRWNERAELLRRKITDYLIVTDPRKGIYFKDIDKTDKS